MIQLSSQLSVRNLAERVFRRGDLYPVRNGASPGQQIDAQDGIVLQQKVQQKRMAADADYRCEVPLRLAIPQMHPGISADWQLDEVVLRGRVDGYSPTGKTVLIEEFKACSALPDEADPVDWGQILIYGGMLGWGGLDMEGQQQEGEPARHIQLNLVYVQVDDLKERCFSRELSLSAAAWLLAVTLLCYRTRLDRHVQRCEDRAAWRKGLAFPFARYRTSQQAVARRVYQALTSRESLLLEAPTGSGKTMAILYPAIISQGLHDQLLFLTSRHIGAQAAMAAVKQLDPEANHIAVVELTAKEKICPVEGMPCSAELCPNAKGYFDRRNEAVDQLLKERYASAARIAEVAVEYQLCPFELSLDTAEWADLIVGDYNYAFDPMVRLQRFAGHKNLHLLIDEAHQLSPRAREMLQVTFARSSLKLSPEEGPPFFLKRVKSIDRALRKIRKEYDDGEHSVAPDVLQGFERAVQRLLDSVKDEQMDLTPWPGAQQIFFACVRWRRSDSWYSSEHFHHLVEVLPDEFVVRRVCLDPADHIATVMAEHGANVRFSGTVSPLPLYQRLHGQVDAAAERAGSPFSPEQIRVLNVTDISTYYRDRGATITRVAQVVRDLITTQCGRYLVALPSYAYLAALQENLARDWDQATPLVVQQRHLSHEDHQQMLSRFASADGAVMLIVSGGVFGESVDFGKAGIEGVVLVGLGLPPPTLERNLIEAHFDEVEGQGWGNMVAFTQPALVKSVQAAGRMLRSPEDRGVICLVDARFTRTEVQQFFPQHWQPKAIKARQLPAEVNSFWQQQ